MNKPIYFLLQHLKIGGVEICITNIANVLVQRGYKFQHLQIGRAHV